MVVKPQERIDLEVGTRRPLLEPADFAELRDQIAVERDPTRLRRLRTAQRLARAAIAAWILAGIGVLLAPLWVP